MTGVDSAIASLLAAQADILMDAMRPGGGSTTGTAQANTSQLFVDTSGNAASITPPSALGAAGPSSLTVLSTVGLTLDAISRFGGGPTPPVMGTAPLWPGLPRLVVAASALAGMEELLFDSDSPYTATAANAANAANQPAPPLPAEVLAETLANVVDESGLFYESHLAQWATGQRPIESLADEPQADADGFTANLPFGPQAAAPRPGAWTVELPDGQGFIDDPLNPMRTVPMPQTPQQATAMAASVRDMPAGVFTSNGGSAGAGAGTAGTGAAAGMATAAHAQDTAVQASIAAGIHPSTIPLVRQQLELLATDQFRWSGEAWPGAAFEWEIEPEDHGGQSQDGSGPDRAWRTRVSISLPMLGTVNADLVLTGSFLVVRVRASEDGGARLFADGEHFRQQLDAAGIQLAGFSVQPLDDSGKAAGHSPSADAVRAYAAGGMGRMGGSRS
jgi:hypothetical protein